MSRSYLRRNFVQKWKSKLTKSKQTLLKTTLYFHIIVRKSVLQPLQNIIISMPNIFFYLMHRYDINYKPRRYDGLICTICNEYLCVRTVLFPAQSTWLEIPQVRDECPTTEKRREDLLECSIWKCNFFWYISLKISIINHTFVIK